MVVILTGYGEVEDYDNFATYNRLALDVLTRKFAPIPKMIAPAMSWYLANSDRQEWEVENNNFTSSYNAIFEQQWAGIETCLHKNPGRPWAEIAGVRRYFQAVSQCRSAVRSAPGKF